MKSSFGWNFCPRTYNVISSDSPVFKFVENNDVKGLQALFFRMEASPFDCDDHGLPLLNVSIISSALREF